MQFFSSIYINTLGLCLGWKGQSICCVTRGREGEREGGREGGEGRAGQGREGGGGGKGRGGAGRGGEGGEGDLLVFVLC